MMFAQAPSPSVYQMEMATHAIAMRSVRRILVATAKAQFLTVEEAPKLIAAMMAAFLASKPVAPSDDPDPGLEALDDPVEAADAAATLATMVEPNANGWGKAR